MDLSKFQTLKETRDSYNGLYKNIAIKNAKWLHYCLLRIAGQSRHDAYKGAGFKDQGIAYSGGSLNSSNAANLEKNHPILIDFIAIGRHKNMLEMLEEQKGRILTPTERMVIASDMITGNYKIKELKQVSTWTSDGKETDYEEFEFTPNMNHRLKAMDILNKMDNSYSQEIVIRKSGSQEIKEMSADELNAALKDIEKILKTE